MPRTSNSKNKITPHTTSLPPQPIQPRPPGLFGMIKEGFAFGVGSSVARNVVDSVMTAKQPAGYTEKKNQCAKEQHEYDLCTKLYTTDASVLCDNETKNLIQCYKS